MKRSLFAVLLSATCSLQASATEFSPPLALSDVNDRAFVESVGNAQKPSPETPRAVLWTRDSQPSWALLRFGEGKTTGPRHLQIGFNRPVTVGSLLVRGGVSVSVLKEGAMAGKLNDSTLWTPAQRLGNGRVIRDALRSDDYALWVLPSVVRARAIRFSHAPKPTDNDLSGRIGGVYLLSERFANVAPQAVVGVKSREESASKLNNDSLDGTWSAWDNGENGRVEVVTPQNPENVVLTWPREVTLSGVATLWTGFGRASVQRYNGPLSRHPREAREQDWETIASANDLKNRYTEQLGPNWIPFPAPVTTRALRLRIETPTNEDHPHLYGKTFNGKRVWLGELMALSPLKSANLQTALLPTPPKVATHPPIPVRFTLAQAGYVTLVIEDSTGKRVRNLVSQTYFPKGANVAWWDGTDDLGRDVEAAKHGVYRIPANFVKPGTYRVRGLVHAGLDLRYEMALYNPGRPAWETLDGTGAWLTNHTPPSAALFVPGTQSPTGKPVVYLGSYVSEGGHGLAWVEPQTGRKLGGRGTVGGAWTGAPFLARDEGTRADAGISAFVGAAWDGELRLTALTRDGDRSVLTPNFQLGGSHDGALRGLACRDGLLVASLGKRNQLLFIDTALQQVRALAALPDPRGLAFDAQGRLLVLSNDKLLRYTMPDSLAPATKLDSQNWTATASRDAANAANAFDRDPNTRWSTNTWQEPGQSYTLDLGEPRRVSRVLLKSGSPQDEPRAYEVQTSDDGQTWRTIAQGTGPQAAPFSGVTRITFAPLRTRHLRITQTGAAQDGYWSINTLELYDVPPSGEVETLSQSQTLVSDLPDPQGLALDATGNIFVSVRGGLHQVKVFDASGKFLRDIGRAGTPKAGPYDRERMNNPAGLAIDNGNRLWVTEEDHTPKRVSQWDAKSGRLLKTFYGPAQYGGGGTLDSRDTSRFYYGGMELRVDWKTGANEPAFVLHRPSNGELSLPGGAPEMPIYAGGAQYFTNAYSSAPTAGASIASLWKRAANGIARPVAALGQANDWEFLRDLQGQRQNFSVRWSGVVVPPTSGRYTFFVTSDDGARLWVNNQQLVNAWRDQSPTENSGEVELQAGVPVPITLEYLQGGGGGTVRLEWQSANQPRQVVPATALRPDANSASNGLRAEYFGDPRLQTLRMTRVDANVNTEWPNGLPADERKAALAARLPQGAEPGRGAWDNSVFFRWSDLNGDANVQPAEIAFQRLKSPVDGVTVMPDMSFVVTNMNGQTRRFAPTLNAKGTPVFPANGQVLLKGAQHPPSSGGGQALRGTQGWTILTNAPAPFSAYGVGGAKNGVPLWSYPSLWPGLHASHESPPPSFPGQIIGHTRLLGPMVTPRKGEAGPLWCVNGNQGNMYLLTQDGLFVAQLFQDVRQGPLWRMPRDTRNMKVNDLSLHDENFWPSITQVQDGTIYLNASLPTIVRVDGLETVKRIAPQLLRVTQADLAKVQTYLAQAESERQKSRGKSTLRVAMLENAPQVDGKLDEWTNADWATIDKSGVAAYFDSNSRPFDISGAVAVSGDRLYASYRTALPQLLRNSGAIPNAPFKTGGALDVMLDLNSGTRLLVTRVQTKEGDKLRAVLYRAKVAGTTKPVPFSSPSRTINLDRADDVSDQVQLADDGKGNYEVSAPLSLFGWTPKSGDSIKGDIGVLRGNGLETQQRVYWNNKATAITSDVPSEAELSPRLWGTFQVEKN